MGRIRVRTSACIGGVAIAVTVTIACGSSQPAAPTQGKYTIDFPTTAAAVATDYVQILVFDVDANNPGGQCDQLIKTRQSSPGDLSPTLSPAAVNICEMLQGLKPLTLPYGDHAVLAIGERRHDTGTALDDLLIGCGILTIGPNDPPAIDLQLVTPNTPLPQSNCTTVGDYCRQTCK
jgi:hypothetical protein